MSVLGMVGEGPLPQPLDIVDRAAFHQLGVLFELADRRIVAPGVRGITQAGQSRVGEDAHDGPVAASVDTQHKDFDAGKFNGSGVAVGFGSGTAA